MKYTTLTFLALLTALSPAQEIIEDKQPGVWTSTSPDGSYFVAMRRMPDDEIIWKTDSDGFRLVVFPLNGDSLGDLYFSFYVGGRLPLEIKWTPDSKFLVFATESTGGHSPWHITTFVFSVDAKKVVCLDGVIGPVVSDEFKIEKPHTGTFSVGKAGEFAGDFEHPTEKKIDLAQLFKKTPKHKTKQAGTAKSETKPADKAPAKTQPVTPATKDTPK